MSSRAAILTVLSAIAIVALFVFYASPPCLFYELTGLKCAGCGMTRAARRLLHGDVAGALRLNAVMVAMTPLLAIGAIASPRSFLKPWVALSIVALLLAWAVLRNVIGL